MYKKHWFLVCLIFMGACASSNAMQPSALPGSPDGPGSPDAIRIEATATMKATATATSTATAAPTSTPTITPTAVPLINYNAAKVQSLSYNQLGQLLIIVDVPGLERDETVYHGWIERYEYKCVRDVAYPEKLFCFGSGLPENTLWTFQLKPMDYDTILLEQKVTIPGVPIPGDLSLYLQGNCEVEPLWVLNPPQGGVGCYAITCYMPNPADPSRSIFKCGTQSTCDGMPTQPCP